MFYDFIYLAKGFRMRPKVRSTLNKNKIQKYTNLHFISVSATEFD